MHKLTLGEEMYQSTPLITSFYINEIYTIHYFEYMSDFDFAGNLMISGIYM